MNLRWALASKRSRCVDTCRSFTTKSSIRSTLIDVNANRSLRFKAILTEALTFDAFGIIRAIEIALAQNVDIDLFACNFRIRFCRIALRTSAIVAGLSILAYRTRRTRLLQCRTLINVRASFVRIAGVIWSTVAHKCARWISAHRIRSARILQTFINVNTFIHRISAKTIRTQTLKTAFVIPTLCISSAWRSYTFIHIVTPNATCIAIKTSRTITLKATLEICAQCTRTACIGQQTFVDVATSIVRIAFKTGPTYARMIARRIEALGVHSADATTGTLVHIDAEYACVALVAIVTLAFPVARFIATFCIFDAKRCNRRIQTFIDIFADQTITAISVATFTLKTANGILAFGEHIARSIIAFVLIWNGRRN